ncbi:uncharacterized protein LOC144003631 isoform X5 [Festucalex cinctus]
MCYRNYCKYMSSRKLHLNTRVSEFRELFKFQHGGERRRIREWRPDNWRRVALGVVSTGVLPSEEQEQCSRKGLHEVCCSCVAEAAMDQTQEGLSQHQVVEEDLDQG